MKNKFSAIVLACLMLFPSSVLAEEVIKSFESLLQVQTDGSIIITETIRVHHEGINIRRGIYRELPTKNGEIYKFIGVKRNGADEPGFVERNFGSYRINTGDDSLLPSPQTSTFEIKYKVLNVPQSYDGYDEVYWNVTGDQWAFPIEEVSARIELPSGAEIIQQSGYVGYTGSKEKAEYIGNGKFKGRYLHSGEQLSVAVGFTPGIVSTEKTVSRINIYKNIVLFVLYCVYLAFLISTWRVKGKDPVGRIIMPRYEAPAELTAAQAACLYNKNETKDIVSISLIQMVLNGFLKLTVTKEKSFLSGPTYLLEKQGKEPSNVEERGFYNNSMELDGKYNSTVKNIVKNIESNIISSMTPYYKRNQPLILFPTMLCLFLMLFICFWGEGLLSLLFLLIFITIFLSTLVSFVTFRTMFKQCLFIGVVFVVLKFLIFTELSTENFQSLLIFLTFGTCSVFAFLMYQPTEKGQRLTEHLEGLKMFLKTTEVPVTDKHKTEEILSLENMEKMFPYAMALGLENEWKNRFENLFGSEEYARFVSSKPYISSNFIRSFNSNLYDSSYSKSGSGSGGRGFSGGGFGGGGGGGR